MIDSFITLAFYITMSANIGTHDDIEGKGNETLLHLISDVIPKGRTSRLSRLMES